MFFTSVGLFMGFFVGLSNGKKLAEEELAKSPNKYNKLEVFFFKENLIFFFFLVFKTKLFFNEKRNFQIKFKFIFKINFTFRIYDRNRIFAKII